MEIRSLARSHSGSALKTLVGIMNEKKAPPAARVAAANSVLDRAWGKPQQTIDATITDERDVSDLSGAELLERTAKLLAEAERGNRGQAKGTNQPSDVCKLN
jgi:hypothetical protein